MIKSLIVLSALFAIALASHGRFGTIQFSKNPSDPQTVTFLFQAVWRRSYYSNPNPGQNVNEFYFYYGDGGSLYIPMTVQSINAAEDWAIVTWTGAKRYAAAGNYQAGLTGCCRISTLRNNNDDSFAFYALVKLTQAEINKQTNVNNSPVSGMLPIVPVTLNTPNFQYQIVASDPENDPITFSMATPAQLGDSSSSHPPGLSVSSTGLVTLSTLLSQGFWTTQQVVTDSFGNWITIDYMLDVQPARTYCNGNCNNGPNPLCVNDFDCSTCNASCIQALPRLITNDISGTATPKTNRPTPLNQQTFNRNVGQQVVVDFVADDANLVNSSTPVVIYQSTIPNGATFTTQADCNAATNCQCVGCHARPQIRSLVWTPTSNDLGSNTVCVGVRSLANYLPYSQHCVTINVIALPITSGAMTSKPLTTQPLTSGDITSQPLTTGDITTQPLTTGDITTQPLTTELLTTGDITTQPLTTGDITTGDITTQPLTTDFFTAADRCATYSWPESQGWFCSADHTGYYQCLKGPWAPQARFRPCAAGTSCKCAVGVECSQFGICTIGV